MIRRASWFWTVLVVLLAASPLAAQVERLRSLDQVQRLPPVEPEPEPYPGRILSFSDSGSGVMKPLLDAPRDTPPAEEVDPDRPRDARPGMFQKLIFNSAWLTSSGHDAWDMTDLELKTALAIPIPSRRWPMVVTPGFAVHFLNGPAAPDLPPKVFDSYVQFRWWRRFCPRFGLDVAVTPGLYGDYQQTGDGALRITGYAAGVFTWTPEARIVLGATYQDRPDYPVLPIAGVTWTPREDVKCDLVFPRPKIAKRILWSGACTEDLQDWIYVAGELGGGIWAVQRPGVTDVITYRDYRAILGLERWDLVGLDFKLELAWVFGRKLTFRSGTPDAFPSDGLLLSGGVTY